ncbi:MAG: ATPase domain-containing protein [archaeon]
MPSKKKEKKEIASCVERISSGVFGLDKNISDGFVKGSVNLLTGGPGTGKSIFAMQFLNYGAENNEPGLYVSFEEDLESLALDAKVFSWDFSEHIKQKKMRFIYLYPYEMQNFLKEIEDNVKAIGAKRVVIDSISNFAMAFESDYEVRKELYALINTLKKLGVTSVLTSEIGSADPVDADNKLSRFGVAEFVCDTVITLHFGALGGMADRAVRIMKMRRTDQTKGPIPMIIGKHGIEILKKEF